MFFICSKEADKLHKICLKNTFGMWYYVIVEKNILSRQSVLDLLPSATSEDVTFSLIERSHASPYILLSNVF